VNWLLSGISGVTWLKFIGLSGGAPDCPVSLQHPRPRSSATNSSLSGIHRGRRDYNSPDCPVSQSHLSQRSTVKSAGNTWLEPTVSWAHQTVRCDNGVAGSTVGRQERKEIAHWTATVAARCTTRQKTGIAFQVGLQRLLAALAL
jgi:hypothetical protein